MKIANLVTQKDLFNENAKVFKKFTVAEEILGFDKIINLPKLKTPANLGKKIFNKNNKQFIKYAMRDAEIGYYIGKFLDDMMQKYDLKQCYSIADLSARIFTHHFLMIILGPKLSGFVFKRLIRQDIDILK